MIFGHSPDFILEAVGEASVRAQMLGAQHQLEIEVSEMVQSMVPCAERVRFAGSGTEAVQLALRAARAFTGRAKFVMFEGMYHGWVDSVAFAASREAGQTGRDGLLPPSAQSEGIAPGAEHDVIMLPVERCRGPSRYRPKPGRSDRRSYHRAHYVQLPVRVP